MARAATPQEYKVGNLIIGDDLTTAAKNIRAELRQAFPGVRFSVRSERFSGGDSIDVRWADGPSSNRVREIVDKYKQGDFDGMTDSYNYSPTNFNKQHGSAKYVQVQRDISAEMVRRCIDAVAVKYGSKLIPTVADFQNGKLWNTTPMGDGPSVGGNDSWQSKIWQQFSEF